MQFAYTNSEIVRQLIKEKSIAILPIGAIEAHGPHLPLGTDNILAEALANRLAQQVDAFVLPTLPYGQVWSLRHFAGSINVSNDSLINLLCDIGQSLSEQGFKIFVIVNGHLGNQMALKEVTRKLYDLCPELKTFAFFYPGTGKIIEELRESQAVHHTFFHADEIETSLMLYVAEDRVDMNKAIKNIPNVPEEVDYTPMSWEQFTDVPVLGDATLAAKEKGKRIIEVAVEKMANLIRQAEKERTQS
ncbi:creatinine amidohydrolase [Caldalkalibacillus uzonensis]|uniref:Creatinine amidohydrolase n=1 Tax=Caldalkalibacillus uzonensis TaxID=353224 RepID=A0ABU0CSE9_9BACI|nr:creatininase family protein [Caldalkalibacillus uzonensis]MDQ0339340.1 creatinine amidohydrolase [Caldalkalibacillus uzonensis]